MLGLASQFGPKKSLNAAHEVVKLDQEPCLWPVKVCGLQARHDPQHSRPRPRWSVHFNFSPITVCRGPSNPHLCDMVHDQGIAIYCIFYVVYACLPCNRAVGCIPVSIQQCIVIRLQCRLFCMICDTMEGDRWLGGLYNQTWVIWGIKFYFGDDLDRSTPDKILFMLEAIKGGTGIMIAKIWESRGLPKCMVMAKKVYRSRWLRAYKKNFEFLVEKTIWIWEEEFHYYQKLIFL